ncbi:Serine/threonine-protein kinase pkn1 [Enhygromyxa salina]|uniref:Serine/threonine-protein kinase pkn1 n=1 Tax=Enhygromyxa salina TaxID=215803 RepID=A0A2S9YJP2_9BACT|nr:SUMF1/EgtB/PvdO family nonheme iron enzyme [Enhygromyxa salina]PRQ05319.1 Serine/threonine-protein kinase pkn1 [Enhygromyxa salina]
MICPARLSAPLTSSIVSIVLCGACTPGEDEAGDAAEAETGAEDSEPLFIPPGTRQIPGGEVWRGCLADDGDCDGNEEPGGWVTVSPFFIDIHEATVESYEDCVDDGACGETPDEPDCNATRNDRDDHPINCVSWDNAAAYCAWRGLRLPTEAEWERAARGDELRLYPWGDDPPSCELAVVDGEGCGGSSTQPVGSLREGDSPFRVADMAGNVSEWVSDYYDADYYAASAGAEDPQGPASGSEHGVKGSAFTVPANFPAQRISKRNFASPDSDLRIYGVRCARDF